MGRRDEVEAVGSLLGDDGFGESIDDIRTRRYRARGREYEDGVIGMGVGDELEGVAFDDAEFNKAFDRAGRRRLDPKVRAAKQRAIRDGDWESVALQGSGLRRDDSAPSARSRPVVLDGADPHPDERAQKLRELEEAEAALAALRASQARPAAPAPEPPAPAPKPAPAAVGSVGDSLDDLEALERELGLAPAGDPKGGHARVSREQAPQETMPTRAEVESAIVTARESGELPPREELEALLDDDEGDTMTTTDEAIPGAGGYMPKAKSVDHISPMCVKRIVDLVWPEGVDLDPFASRSEFATIESAVQFFGPDDEDEPLDGLDEEWDLFAGEETTRAYVNSPYGRFISKACEAIVAEVSSADVRVIALLKSCTDTGWFHKYVAATATAVCFVRGRLRYIDGKTGKAGPAPFPSILILWDDERFAEFKHACEVYVDEDRKHPLGHVVDLRVGRDEAA